MKPLKRNIQMCSHKADLNFCIFSIIRNQGFQLQRVWGSCLVIVFLKGALLTWMAARAKTNKANVTRSNRTETSG